MKFAAYPKYRPSGVEWLGDVPEHWQSKRLKTAVRLTDRKVEADEENPVPYIGLENIESWTGRLLPIDPDVVPTGTANAFKAGHTLFGKLRPYLAKACNPEFDGLCSTELLVLDGEEIDRRTLLYLLLADGFISLVDSSTYGSKMPRASWDFIGNCIVPVPPSDEQHAIADFLDRETAKIDTLVAKKRLLIERLKEKRTALISRTVTRGLPPDAARAAGLDPHPKLKPSGIDWLGDVPEHWRITRLSRVVACLDGRRIPLNREERSERQGPYPYWGANGIVDSVDEWLFDEPLVLLGEDGAPFFALNKEVAFFVTGKIWVNNHAHVLRPFAGIDGEFLAHALNHTEYGAFIDGSTRDKLTQDDMNAIPIATPPHAEQRAIARFLDRETAKIDTMIATVETAIERLQEYRTALITAAVTGKIDVRALSGADAAGTMTP